MFPVFILNLALSITGPEAQNMKYSDLSVYHKTAGPCTTCKRVSLYPSVNIAPTRSPQLQVFRPFFVSLNLPYAVKRGEVVGIQCVVFNYHDRDLIADVTLEHQGDLEFTSFSDEAANEVEGKKKEGTNYRLDHNRRLLEIDKHYS